MSLAGALCVSKKGMRIALLPYLKVIHIIHQHLCNYLCLVIRFVTFWFSFG